MYLHGRGHKKEGSLAKKCKGWESCKRMVKEPANPHQRGKNSP